MRQAGMLAAAGHYALEHNVSRLADDHANARFLAQLLDKIEGVHVDLAKDTTNMVYAHIADEINIHSVAEQLKAKDILISPNKTLRLVIHLGVTRADIELFIAELTAALHV